jgi:hypothetical protein
MLSRAENTAAVRARLDYLFRQPEWLEFELSEMITDGLLNPPEVARQLEQDGGTDLCHHASCEFAIYAETILGWCDVFIRNLNVTTVPIYQCPDLPHEEGDHVVNTFHNLVIDWTPRQFFEGATWPLLYFKEDVPTWAVEPPRSSYYGRKRVRLSPRGIFYPDVFYTYPLTIFFEPNETR